MNPHFGSRNLPPTDHRSVSIRQTLGELWELIRPRRGVLGVGLLMVLVNRVAGLVLPGSTKYLIDDVLGAGDMSLLMPLTLAVGGAALVQAASAFGLTMLLGISAQRLITDMRIEIQKHIGRLPVRFFDANKAGGLVSRVMSDVEGVRNLIGTGLVQFLGGIITAVFAFAILMTINPMMTLVSLAFLPVFGLVLRKAFGTIRPIFRERGRIRAEVTGRLTESFGGVRVVKGFQAESREADVFRRGALRLFDNVRQSMTATAVVSLTSTLLLGAISITAMLVGTFQINAGGMTIGEFVSFTLYMGFMVAPVVQVVQIGTQLTEAIAGLDRVREVMTLPEEDADPARSLELGEVNGHVVFDNVSFEYEPGVRVLRNIDLDARPGTVTALAGSSGSGKSTLIGLVAAFANPIEGSILVDGVDLRTIRLDSYRKHLGVVLQDSFLFDGTIRENILFGAPDARQDAVEEAARIACVDEFALGMEKGYDTVIGERGVKLSGGQRQRVSIARAILADPRILILDEATSSLDTESESLIQEGLSALMKGRTTFVIAHRLSTIRSADQILILEGGRIVERGSHEALLERRGRYFDLYTRQADFEANRFRNPGEREPADEDADERDQSRVASEEDAPSFRVFRRE